MALETYRKKRDFSATPEPRGERETTSGHTFVIQKHDATRLHYDFRLEMNGVLKSWAVTRGPSLSPGEKRLAVHVEDHPLEYGDFEGTIPKGEYGGGTVIVWDRGIWKPLGDAQKAYAKGHLEFELSGAKLNGRWHLIRMRGKQGEKRENWLLVKGDDAFARTKDEPDILDELPDSVQTGRSIMDVAGRDQSADNAKPPSRMKSRKPKSVAAVSSARKTMTTSAARVEPTDLASIAGAKKTKMPAFIEPMLASLVTAAPVGKRWLHEIKFDGYRLQARIETGRVQLLTRSGLDWSDKFGGSLVSSLRDLPVSSAIIDGEVVVETASGATDFSALQADLSDGRTDRFAFYVFDLPYVDGHDLRAMPLFARKALLEKITPDDSRVIKFSSHFEESGDMVLRHACRLSLEGIVSKVHDAPYRSGRSKNWVKSKCSSRQEFVIGGYLPSSVTRESVGSLALGVYEGGALQYVGRVGTGFTGAVATQLHKRLEPLHSKSSPFAKSLTPTEARKVKYVRPEQVAEVEFRAWTADGHLRHASFRGLRDDKPATEIVREVAKINGAGPKPQRRTVRLTHPDRVYWPDEGITKEGLADYYAEIWRHIAPWVVGRPLALLRCPTGINGHQFFQKHAWKGLNPKIETIVDPEGSSSEPLICINDLDGLMGLVQAAVLEIHPWGSSVTDLEKPDMIVIDLDPGEGVTWDAVVSAAHEVRQRLSDAKLQPFVKTSGGKGLHIVAPLRPQADWAVVKSFSKELAAAMAKDSPSLFVSSISKAKRRGKIFIDYLRNQRGATAIAAYSTRARPGAAVSTPLSWDELGPNIGPDYFTLENIPKRLTALSSDPWDGFRIAEAPLKTNSKSKGLQK